MKKEGKKRRSVVVVVIRDRYCKRMKQFVFTFFVFVHLSPFMFVDITTIM